MLDVCLILEGTYPYVSGGVSTWVHGLITSLREIKFGIVHIGSRDIVRDFKYTMPSNLLDLRDVFIHEYSPPEKLDLPKRGQPWHDLEQFHVGLRNKDASGFKSVMRGFCEHATRSIDGHDMLFSKEAWDLVQQLYRQSAPEVSYVDYFWTWRCTHLPIQRILAADIPEAGVYHTVSTGYAGMLAAMAKIRYQRPMLLTEHGIYAKERRIEIDQSTWINEPGMQAAAAASSMVVSDQRSFFRDWWIRMFAGLSRIAYRHADEIITLFEGNRELQIADGADPGRTRIIPNGIDVDKITRLRGNRTAWDGARPFRVGLMGRVVPIKDIKTFLRACRLMVDGIRPFEAYIMGPQDEDPEYRDDCLLLSSMLGLDGVVKFTGRINPDDYYPMLDVIVLTSISEAQPLVILEANCMGIPCVATNVGACPELLAGRSRADRDLGPSGLVTRIAAPQETADAVLQLARRPDLYAAMSAAGIKRTELFYREEDLNANYLELYDRYRYQRR